MEDSSSSDRDFRKAKWDFRSAVDQWATTVSKGEVSADELRVIKQEVEQYFEAFAAARSAVKDSKTDHDEVEDLKECFETFEQVFSSVVREYDSLHSNFKFREIKELFGVQKSKFSRIRAARWRLRKNFFDRKTCKRRRIRFKAEAY